MFHHFIIILIFLNRLKEIQSEPSFINPNLLILLNSLNWTELLPKSDCLEDLQFLTSGEGDKWTIQMIDATAKLQPGSLEGNIAFMGNFDECLSIDGEILTKRIQGKYCTASFRPHSLFGEQFQKWMDSLLSGAIDQNTQDLLDESKISYGFCLPESCSAETLQTIVDFAEMLLKSPIHFKFEDEFCISNDKEPFSKSAVAAIVIFSVCAGVIVFSSLYDIFYYRRLDSLKNHPNLYVAFSVIKNGEKLLSTKSSEENIKCLNGFRVISMMWVVLVHTYQYNFFVPCINPLDLLNWKDQAINAFILAGPMSVDTFFVVSGLLVVYLFMKSRDKNVKFSLSMFYIHRIIRLTPSLAMVILFSSTLLKHIGNGPFWPIVHKMLQADCEKNWWISLMYLQNYIQPDNKCVPQSWYLAVDTQMYFISPLILFPLIKWPKRTLIAICGFVLLNCAFVFEETWVNEYGVTFIDYDSEMFRYLYYPTHVRGAAYLIGMICGYYVYKTRTSMSLKMSDVQVAVLWAFSVGLFLTIIFAHSLMVYDKGYDVMEASFFSAFSRIGWCLSISIMIVLCVNGYEGPINSFLSHDVFTLLIRLNYSIYLLHLNVIIVILAQGRHPKTFSNLSYIMEFCGYYAFSVLAAFIWTLAFESPILEIEKIIFSKGKKIQNPITVIRNEV